MTLYKQHLFPSPSLLKQLPSRDEPLGSSTLTSKIPSLTHHITLPFVPLAPFGPGLSLEEVREQEVKFRREFVADGEVAAIIRTSGSTRVGRFTFKIGEDEVLVGSACPIVETKI